MSLKMINGIRPKNKRVERALLKREPQVHEYEKTAMFIKGPKTSGIITQALKDLYAIKKPSAVMLKKHNQKRPFEDETEIEFLSDKNDCSLFAFGSHTKKKPHDLILGRCFDHKILDMCEMGIENFKSMQDFKAAKAASAVGSKPCFIFRGVDFEYKEEIRKFANLVLDFFRGRVVDEINLEGLDHVIICTALDNKIYFRHYAILLKRVAGSRLPKVELEEIGPSMDLVMRRTKFATRELMKEAMKVPQQAKAKKVKNISTNVFGTLGRVHKGRQDFDSIATRKMKGLKRKRGAEVTQEGGDVAATSQQGEDRSEVEAPMEISAATTNGGEKQSAPQTQGRKTGSATNNNKKKSNNAGKRPKKGGE